MGTVRVKVNRGVFIKGGTLVSPPGKRPDSAFKPGDVVDIPASNAQEIIRSSRVEPYEAPPEPAEDNSKKGKGKK